MLCRSPCSAVHIVVNIFGVERLEVSGEGTSPGTQRHRGLTQTHEETLVLTAGLRSAVWNGVKVASVDGKLKHLPERPLQSLKIILDLIALFINYDFAVLFISKLLIPMKGSECLEALRLDALTYKETRSPQRRAHGRAYSMPRDEE